MTSWQIVRLAAGTFILLSLTLGVPGSPFHKSIRKGLDLQGGLEVVLQAQPPRGHVLTSADMTNSINIMRSRIDKLGVSEPVVTRSTPSFDVVMPRPALFRNEMTRPVLSIRAYWNTQPTPVASGPSSVFTF